jgi:hypothetical protein
MRALGVLLTTVLTLWPAPVMAHEERLLVGRVETVEPARKLLVVRDTQRGDRRRLEVNQETEVMVCRTGTELSALRPGGLVRVKYMERSGGELEVRSILLLGPAK